jgi:hypothetical protein
MTADTEVPTLGPVLPNVSPNVPIWVVAIKGDNLRMLDVLHLPPGFVEQDDERPVVGAAYIWDANSGTFVTEFGLLFEIAYQSVEGMQNQQIPIEAATYEPNQ